MTTLRRALDYYNSSSSHAKVGIVVCIQRPLFAYYSWYIYEYRRGTGFLRTTNDNAMWVYIRIACWGYPVLLLEVYSNHTQVVGVSVSIMRAYASVPPDKHTPHFIFSRICTVVVAVVFSIVFIMYSISQSTIT